MAQEWQSNAEKVLRPYTNTPLPTLPLSPRCLHYPRHIVGNLKGFAEKFTAMCLHDVNALWRMWVKQARTAIKGNP